MLVWAVKSRRARVFVALVCSFAIAALGVVGTAHSARAANKPDFFDVPVNAKFYKEITLLADRKVTTGYADGGFHPKSPVSRAAFAAFLYRMLGEHDDKLPKQSPFKDVKPVDQFYKEIIWVYQMGISTGYSDKTFRPRDGISREAIAAFLYRFEKPDFEAPSKSPFKDMTTRSKFYKEVTWMADMHFSTGYSDGTYRPKIDVSREAVAAFLYRAYFARE
jgi:hypothetical protein